MRSMKDVMAARMAVVMMAKADFQPLDASFSPLRAHSRSGILLIDPPLTSPHGGRFSQAG